MQGSGFSVLIYGETGRGKTRLAWVMARLMAGVRPGGVFVADFAPARMGVGAPMPPVPGAIVRRPSGLRAPRLESGGDCGVAWRLAQENARLTSAVLEEYLSGPGRALVVNDLTIHVHAGDPGLLLRAIEAAPAFVGTAYYGSRISDECGLSEREMRFVEDLASRVDVAWRL